MTARAVGAVDERVDVWSVHGSARRVRFRASRFRWEVVERRRLLATLAAGRDRRVVLICAPAGFGKTILAAQLTGSDPRPGGWIQLEDSDNDPVVLLNDVVQMFGELGSIAPRITRELESRAPRVEEVVLALLGEQLASFDPFVVVLDDIELVRHPTSLAILSFLAEHVPPGSQLVLGTRGEPDVSLGRLRAAGEVLDVRTADLAFDLSETRELLATGDVHLSDDQVKAVRERTEGWAAGIALAMLSREGRAFERDFHAVAIGALPHLRAYLIEEAVESQPPDVRRFLLASSVLRRMSPALCDAALEITNSGRLLAALERDSLFVVPLGGEGDWYRYHHQFRELLQMELRRQAPVVIGGVLSRAAAWHEHRGDPREAFEYAHACGELTRAGRIVLRHVNGLIARGQIGTLRSWLARCTPGEIASDSQLALARAWVALLSGEAAEAWRLAAVADKAGDLDVPSPDGATSLRSAVANLRATLATDGVSQMLRDGEFVVAAEGSAGTRWMMDGWRGVATAHLLKGSPEQAIAAFAEVLRGTKGRPDFNYITINCLGYSALAAADGGDWRRARKWAREARALTTESGLEHVIQSVAPSPPMRQSWSTMVFYARRGRSLRMFSGGSRCCTRCGGGKRTSASDPRS